MFSLLCAQNILNEAAMLDNTLDVRAAFEGSGFGSVKHVGDKNGATLSRKRCRDGTADAACSSRNQRPFANESL